MEALTSAKAFDILFYIATGILGYLLNSYSQRIKSLEASLVTLQSSIPEKYVQKNDMRDFEDRVLSALNRIEDKLDRKQDK